MNEHMWERWSAASGIAFFVLLMASLLVVPAPPAIDATPAKIVEYFNENREQILLAQVLGTLAVLPFLWFLGHIRHVVQRAEGGAEKFSPVIMASGITAAAVAAVAAVPTTTLAFMSDQTGALSNAALVNGLYDAGMVFYGLVGVLASLFLVSTGAAMVTGELAAPWLGWLGVALAAVSLAGGVAMFYATSATDLATVAGFAIFLAAPSFVGITGAVLMARPEVDRVGAEGGAHRQVFAH